MGPDDELDEQIRYDLTDETGTDSSTERIKYADEVDRPAVQALWDPFLYSSVFGAPESLAPGLPSVKYDWNDTIATMMSFGGDVEQTTGPVEVWGFLPHMHKRGRHMMIELETGGQKSCAADVDRYDFAWQTAYFLEQPLQADLSDKMYVTCDWDTRGDTEPVMPGFN